MRSRTIPDEIVGLNRTDGRADARPFHMTDRSRELPLKNVRGKARHQLIETKPVHRLLRYLSTAIIFASLTLLTQIGGLAYLLGLAAGFIPALRLSRRWLRRTAMLTVAVASYTFMTLWLGPPLAQLAGRVRLPCSTNSEGPVVAATWLTCALNRGYVRPEVLTVVLALGDEIGRQFPGSRVTALEANFPFVDGFPLLPHLSHRDGRKVDLAYFYRSTGTNAPIAHGSPSWLGYFIYEQPREGDPLPCAGRWTPLRWNFEWLQPRPTTWRLDPERTAWVLTWLKEQPRVARLSIEPHLAQRLGIADGIVRFPTRRPHSR